MVQEDGINHIFVAEIIFALGLFAGRCVVYLLMIKGFHEVFSMGYNVIKHKQKFEYNEFLEKNKKYSMVFVAAAGLLVYQKAETLDLIDFVVLYIAYFITKYPEMEVKSKSINYGIGMACSYFEGYLSHIIPSDGARFVGFEENINIYEARQNVVFPVKKLFIIINKSLYCPPDLKHFNKTDKSLPYLEACQSLEVIEKDVAGVKNRVYRNSAYKIHRVGAPPAYLAVECATPLHTLHRVLDKRTLCEELGTVNVEEVVDDFCTTLRKLIDKSAECRGKCELVYFDDKDPNQNLADVLLEKIRELEPQFESMIKRE
ncbi:stimulator of interferon genes protein-like isoform X2 [Zerene cesonia]|uniref:stimulator of interferon genes protein-like isoform X2 n=1 Tax=Zerene cesonia TaxID=33412 RepID=UPI0018E535AA|nr:stimulator of interferon genes protein-like isoform X2 [Zerene cesonia]